MIAAQVVEGKMISSYGVFDAQPVDGFNGRLFEIRNMVEKPKPEEAPSNLAIIGRYILTPAIFDCLAKTQTGAGGELQLTDGMRMLLKQEKMYAYVYEGKPLRHRRQAGIPESHGGIRPEALRPGRPLPRISERLEADVRRSTSIPRLSKRQANAADPIASEIYAIESAFRDFNLESTICNLKLTSALQLLRLLLHSTRQLLLVRVQLLRNRLIG